MSELNQYKKFIEFLKDNLIMILGDYHDGDYFVILEPKIPAHFQSIVIKITKEEKDLLKSLFGNDILKEIDPNPSIEKS